MLIWQFLRILYRVEESFLVYGYLVLWRPGYQVHVAGGKAAYIQCRDLKDCQRIRKVYT